MHYTNPISQTFDAKFTAIEPQLIYNLYSSFGTNLISDELLREAQSLSIDFSGYPNGVYFLHVTDEQNNTQVFKILKLWTW